MKLGKPATIPKVPLIAMPTRACLPLCLDPAATNTILPVLWVLQTVAVEVLPRTEKSLTALVGTPPRLVVETLILLSTTSGAVSLLNALTLWTQNLVVRFGVLSEAPVTIFVSPLVRVPAKEEAGAIKDEFPISATELAISIPPRALVLIIIILLSTLPLDRSPMPTMLRLVMETLWAPQLTKSIIRTLPSAVLTAQPLLRLETILASPFPNMTPVLTTGALLEVLATALATACPSGSRVAVLTLPALRKEIVGRGSVLSAVSDIV